MSNEEILALLRNLIQEELNPIKMELQDCRAQMISRFDMLKAKLLGVEDVVATIEASVKHLEETHGLSSKIGRNYFTQRL